MNFTFLSNHLSSSLMKIVKDTISIWLKFLGTKKKCQTKNISHWLMNEWMTVNAWMPHLHLLKLLSDLSPNPPPRCCSFSSVTWSGLGSDDPYGHVSDFRAQVKNGTRLTTQIFINNGHESEAARLSLSVRMTWPMTMLAVVPQSMASWPDGVRVLHANVQLIFVENTFVPFGFDLLVTWCLPPRNEAGIWQF